MNISAHAHMSAPVRTCGCGVRCGNFWYLYVRVGCSAEWLKKCHRTRTLMAGKIWENFLAFFQIFQKTCFHTAPYLTILLKNFSALQLTPHNYFSSASTPHLHIRIPLNTCSLKEFYCAVRCGCGRKIMMWGEVRCG